MSRDHTTQAEAWSVIRAALPGGAGVHPRADGTAGKYGIRFLPDSSWTCDGPVSDAARTLLEIFAPLVSRGDALVIGQLGQSLDGRIATDNGASHYINGRFVEDDQGSGHLAFDGQGFANAREHFVDGDVLDVGELLRQRL